MVASYLTTLFPILLLATQVFCPRGFAQQSDADQETIAAIKAIIPAATALSEADWRRLSNGTANDSGKITPMSIFLSNLQNREENKINEADQEALRDEFSSIGILDSAWLAREISRGDHRTWVNENRITKLTCVVDGCNAKGMVHFVIPAMIRGKFQYTAIKSDGEWSITSFVLPVRQIKLSRNSEGDWRQEKWEVKD